MRAAWPAIAAFLFAAAPALALPPGWDYYGDPLKPFIYCKNKEDLRAVVAAAKRKRPLEADSLFKAAEGAQSKCEFGEVGSVQAGENEDMGTYQDSAGQLVRAWMVHVGNSYLEVWLLWTEPTSANATTDGKSQ